MYGQPYLAFFFLVELLQPQCVWVKTFATFLYFSDVSLIERRPTPSTRKEIHGTFEHSLKAILGNVDTNGVLEYSMDPQSFRVLLCLTRDLFIDEPVTRETRALALAFLSSAGS